MAGINGIDPRKMFILGSEMEFDNNPVIDMDLKTTNAFATPKKDMDMGLRIQSNSVDPVEEGDKTEPQKKNTNVPIFTKDDLMRVINGMYCGDSELRNEINMALAENGSYQATYSIGSIPFTVTFTKDDDGKITAEYDMPSYEIVYKTVTEKSEEIKKDGFASKFDGTELENFNEWSQTMLNPKKSKEERAEAERQLGELITKYDKDAKVRVSNGVDLKYGENQIKRFKNGISPGAKAEIQRLKDMDKIDNTEVFIASGKIFDRSDYKAYQDAKTALEADKARVEAELAASGEEPTPDQLAILKKEVKYIFNKDIVDFVNGREYLFYTNGAFDSDKYKEFVGYLTGGDAHTSISDQKTGLSEVLMNLPTDKDAETGKKAYEAVKKLQRGEELSEEETRAYQKIKNNRFFHKIQGGDNSLQLQMVRAAGGSGKYDPSLLLTTASVMLSLAGIAFNLSGMGMKQVQEMHLMVNGETIPFVNGQPVDLSQYIVPGQPNTFEAMLHQSQSMTTAWIPPILFGSQQSQNGLVAADFAGKTFKQDAIKGKVDLGCVCDEPQTPADDNVTVIHDEQGNTVKINACSDETELGCDAISKTNNVRSATEEEIRQYLEKQGKTYNGTDKYNWGLQRWQLEKAFGVGEIQDKELKAIVKKAIKEQVLGGNDAIPAGKEDYKACLKIVVNGVEQDYYMTDEEYWKNAQPVLYKTTGGTGFVEGKPIPKVVKDKNGHAKVTISVNGKVVYTIDINNVIGGRENAKQEVLKQVPDEYKEAVKEALDNCNC